MRELIKLKDDLIAETATPPMYLKTDLLTYSLKDLNCKFDVILIEPPLEEYQRTCGATNVQLWNWDQVSRGYRESTAPKSTVAEFRGIRNARVQ